MKLGMDTRFRSALVALLCAAASISVTAQGQLSRQVLHNHVRREVSSGQAAVVGRVPSTQRMQLSIFLPLRNQTALTELLGRLYDPSSPDFHHFLSVDQFTQQFGPTAEDYQAVVDLAKANGFSVTDSTANRLIVPISGTAAQVEKAFNVRMNNYRHPTENRDFFSPDREPSLNLSVPVAHISGLNNFSIPRPALMRASGANVTRADSGSGPEGLFLPGDMRAAYYASGDLNGSGQAVGLFEFYGGYSISDVTGSFDGTATSTTNGSNYVLAYTPSAGGITYNVPINNVLLDGVSGATTSDNDAEQVLDIVQAIGMAPGLAQVRVYIGASDPEILNSMATEDICKQISISWLWTPDDPSTDDPIFQEFAAQGQSVFAASGDFGGYNPGDTVYPAEDAYVTTVGGTDLVTNGPGGSWNSESAWIDSSGGIGLDGIPIPEWQAGVANSSNQGSTSLRNVPDVAMEANTDNYLCAAPFATCDVGIGGTSASTPRWAAFMSLVDQQAEVGNNSDLGFINPAVYSIGGGSNYSNDFHDISTGSNNCCESTLYYNAVTGYDLVTGWGSPDGQNLIDALAGPLSNPVITIAASPNFVTTYPGASGTSTILVNSLGGFSGAVNLTVSGLPSGVTASFSANPAAGSSVLTITVAASAAPGNYPLTITGTAGNLTSTASLALTIDPPGFSLSASSGMIQISPSTPGTNTVTVTPLGDFSGAVNLTASGLPSGVTASFSPNPATGSSVLTLTSTISATTGTSTVTITGTSGAASASTSFVLDTDPATTFPPKGYATSSLNFGPVNIGATSAAIPLSFAFLGHATVASTSVLTEGATSLDFANAGSGTCTANLTVPAGGSCTVNVTFTPEFAGIRNGAVVLTDNSGNVIATGYVQGSGVGPQIDFLPNTETAVASSGISNPYGVAVDGSGAVYIADTGNLRILKETPTGADYTQSTVPTSTLSDPIGIAVDGNGNVYIADPGTNRILKETPTAGSYSESVVAEGLGPPLGVAVDGNGNVYVAITTYFDTSNNLVPGVLYEETLVSGGYSQKIIPTPDVIGLSGVAVDGSGNVYITENDSGISPPPAVVNERVLKETVSGGSYTQAVIPTSGLGTPWGIAVDANGNIYISDTINRTVLKETLSSGGYIQSKVLTSLLDLPVGIAVQGNGNVYIGDTFDFRVLKEDYADAPSLTFDTTAVGATSIDSPQTITVENIGNAALSFSAVGYPASFPEGSPATTDCTAATSVSANQTCTLTIDFSPLSVSAIAQSLVLTDNALNQSPATQSISLNGLGTPAQSFTLGASPNSLTVVQGGASSTSTIAVTSANGFAGGVTLVASGLPGGVTASFSPNPTAGTSVLTLTASSTASLGSATVTITGTSGSITSSTSLVLTVNAPPPSFTLGASPVSLTIVQGGASSSSTIAVTGVNGFAGSVTLAASGLPSGVTASFSPNPTKGTSVLTLTATGAASPGSVTVTITGTSGSLAASTSLALTVNAAPPGFTLGASPSSLTVVQGEVSSALTIAVNDVGGFAGSVTLAVSGLPNGVTASFNPNPTAGTSVLTLTVSSAASLGSATLTITGTSGSLTASTSLVLTVTPVELIGTQSPVIPVTVTFNTAGTLSSTAVLTQGETGLDFANVGAGTCTVNTAYIAGQTCTVNVTFTPRFAGTREGAVVLENNSGNVLATSDLLGTGMGPQIEFLPNAESVVANASSGLLAPYAMAVDGSGNIYVADVGANAVFKETLSAGIYSESILPTSSLNQPTGVAVDGGGNVYIADTNNSRVLKEIPFAGGYIESVVANSVNNGINFPIDLAADGNGSVYFFCSSTLYIEAPSAGGYIQGAVPYSGISSPGGLAADGNGNVYIVDFGDNQVVKETPTNSGYIQSTVPTNGLNQPSGIAVDGMGNIYVADIGGGPIFKETLTAGSYTQSTIATSPLNEPLGVAVDQAGNVYIGDAGTALVLKEDFADAPSLAFASTASGVISSDSPQTVTVENAGNLALNFPIPSTGSNPSISTNFTLNSAAPGACPLVKSGSSAMGTLATGASCQLPVSFAPTAIGTFSGSLALTDNNLNAAAPGYAAQTVKLSGMGTQIAPMITWATPSPITYGTALSKTQLNAKSSVAGSFSYSPVAGTVLGAGQQTLTVTFTPTNTTEYATVTATVTLTVNQATPAITWATPKAITYGTPLSGLQLNASTRVAGTFAYSPASGTALNAGVQALTATFTPADSVDYAGATAMVMLTVNKATLTITWPTPTAISYGTALTGMQLDANSTAAGAFVYSPAAGTVLSVGSHTLTVTLTPISPANYTTSKATATVSLTVNKAIPSITWATPAAISYGTALSATQLDASSTLAGTFTYSPAAGTVLNTASQSLSVTFTPFNTADYATATDTVILTVNKATPTITWATPAAITYGTALSGAQLDASSNVAGTFAYSPAAGTILAVGSQTLSVTFTPFNATDYTTATGSTILTVKKAAPAITWATPKAINYGTVLSATQLDASSTVAGTFAYSPAAGTVLTAGSQTLSVTFNPSNTTDYTTAVGSVVLTVNKATPTVTLTSSASSVVSGTSVTFTATVAGGGVEPTGTVTFFDGSKQLGTGALNGSGVATFATSTLAVGKQSITASYGGNTNYLTEASSVVIVTVSAH